VDFYWKDKVVPVLHNSLMMWG